MRSRLIIGIILSCMMVAAQAVTIYPNRVVVQGKPGTRASIQIKVYGHSENVSVEFVKVADLTSTEDTVLQTFELGRESQRIIPVDIILEESKEYYLCAVLKKSQSMRLRVCSAVRVTVNP